MGAIADYYRTGALNQAVKDDPLPVGVYWIDVIGATFGGGIGGVGQNDANIDTFRDWLTLNSETVELLREEEYNPTAIWNSQEPDPHRFWFLFEVKAPTVWGQALSLGWPSEGTKNMVSADTIDKPDPEEVSLPGWANWAIGGGVIVIGLLAIVAVRR
jgi:hypothetical protein